MGSTQNLIYAIGGLFILVLNSIIVVAILKARSLCRKKEYLILVGMAIADVAFGLAYFWQGSFRLYLISNDLQNEKISVWDCMQKPHVLIVLYGVQLSSVMLTCVSVDRMLSISCPIWYFKQRTKYAYRLVGMFYLFVFINCTALVLISCINRDQLTSLTCLGGKVLGKGLAPKYSFMVRFLAGAVSVALYIAIPFIYRRNNITNKKTTENRDLKRKVETQKKLMKTLGIAAGFTFAFYVVPNFIKMFAVGWVPADVLDTFGPYITCFTLVNPMANFFLYTLRHEEMRKAVFGLIPGYKVENTVAPSAVVVAKKPAKATGSIGVLVT